MLQAGGQISTARHHHDDQRQHGVARVTGSKTMTGRRRSTTRPPRPTCRPPRPTPRTPPLDLVDIVVSDVDSPTVTATLTLSDPAAGSLSTATSGAVTSTYVPGTGVWTASGPIADVNTLLAGVTFTPGLRLQRELHDRDQRQRGVAAAVTGSKAVTGTPVNDAPGRPQR